MNDDANFLVNTPVHFDFRGDMGQPLLWVYLNP